MVTIAIRRETVQKEGGVVVLPIKVYQKLLEGVVPTYYLRGKEAVRLDKLVSEGLKEYKSGKTRVIRSLADLAS